VNERCGVTVMCSCRPHNQAGKRDGSGTTDWSATPRQCVRRGVHVHSVKLQSTHPQRFKVRTLVHRINPQLRHATQTVPKPAAQSVVVAQVLNSPSSPWRGWWDMTAELHRAITHPCCGVVVDCFVSPCTTQNSCQHNDNNRPRQGWGCSACSLSAWHTCLRRWLLFGCR
jgi:hypothetical protein